MWKQAQWVKKNFQTFSKGWRRVKVSRFFEILSLFKVDIIIVQQEAYILCNNSFIISGFLAELENKTFWENSFGNNLRDTLLYFWMQAIFHDFEIEFYDQLFEWLAQLFQVP